MLRRRGLLLCVVLLSFGVGLTPFLLLVMKRARANERAGYIEAREKAPQSASKSESVVCVAEKSRVSALDYSTVFATDNLIKPEAGSPFRTSFSTANAMPLSNEVWESAHAALGEIDAQLRVALKERADEIPEWKKAEFWEHVSSASTQHFVPASEVLVHRIRDQEADTTNRCIVTTDEETDIKWRISSPDMILALWKVGFYGRFINYRGHFPQSYWH